MKKPLLLILAILALFIQVFPVETRTLESVSVVEGEAGQDGILLLNDGTVWGWSPYFEDSERVLSWQEGDQVFIAPFKAKGEHYLTLFNLTREKAPEEEEVDGIPYYIQPEVAPIFIWSKGGAFHQIIEIEEDAGWIYTDLVFILSNGTCYKVDSGKLEHEWEVGDHVLFSQLSDDDTLLLINITKQEALSEMEECSLQQRSEE